MLTYAGLQARGELWRAHGITAVEHARLSVDAAARPAAAAVGLEPAPATPGGVPSIGALLGTVRIPSTGIEVPVRYGTAASVLSAGAGLVEGTGMPGDDGNVAIAAHRDSFFRSLEHIAVGDPIELDTPTSRRLYRVSDLSVVEPTDTYVLADDGSNVLTLITCYPFRFIGSAPQRFIVRALAVELPETQIQRIH